MPAGVSVLYDDARSDAPPGLTMLLAALAQTRLLSVPVRGPVDALHAGAQGCCMAAGDADDGGGTT